MLLWKKQIEKRQVKVNFIDFPLFLSYLVWIYGIFNRNIADEWEWGRLYLRL